MTVNDTGEIQRRHVDKMTFSRHVYNGVFMCRVCVNFRIADAHSFMVGHADYRERIYRVAEKARPLRLFAHIFQNSRLICF